MSDGQENNHMEGKPGGFSLPADYFDQLAGKMTLRLEWQEEHRAYPALLRLRSKAVWSIPEGYFEKGACRVELAPYPRLCAMSVETGMSVPFGYFDRVRNKLLECVPDGHREPHLGGLPKRHGFGVPPDYFNGNSARLGELLAGAPEKHARVISIRAPKRVGLAVAALLLLALGLWVYRQWLVRPAEQDCGTIACVDKKDLLKTRVLDNLETDELYELVNSKELEKKLQEEPSARTGDSSAGSGDQELDELMDGI